MRALCWHGVGDVRVDTVPDPEILNPRDAIVKITSTAICGSDLHLYGGKVPSMEKGDILGHEFMGEVVEVGRGVNGKLRKGDRVVVPFPIACGNCYYCKHEQYSACDNSNPNAAMLEALNGYSGAALYGYSHMYGGYAGGQAEYVRVPFADVGPLKIENDLADEQVLFLTDIFPTGYQAAEQCGIKGGDTVAVWGCGPVGLFAIQSAYLLGAGRVIAIDRFRERLDMARDIGKAEVINYESDTDDLVEKSLRGANLWNEVKDRLDRPGSSLSGGQQQRLCIARAIAVEPDVLLMDEPCSALDPISTLAIEDLMAELKERFTIVIVTHNMQQAARVSESTGFFNLNGVGQPGRLIEFNPTEKIFSNPDQKATEDYISGRFG